MLIRFAVTCHLGEATLEIANRGDNFAPVVTPNNLSKRILVVDDEPAVGDAIRRVLELDKHQVTTLATAPEALTSFQDGLYDLVIVDYELPDMKGDKLAAAIKQKAPGQPILMITAYAESLRFGGEFPLPVDLVIAKPFAIQELRQAVQRLVTRT